MFGFRRHAKATESGCSHAKALPRWDKVEDTGNLERVSTYYCPSCDQFLTPDRMAQPSAAAASTASE